MNPYNQDEAVCRAAELLDAEVLRLQHVEIDLTLLPSRYWKSRPDVAAIRSALKSGAKIPGAKLTDRIDIKLVPRDDSVS